jgi:hypothetical protein
MFLIQVNTCQILKPDQLQLGWFGAWQWDGGVFQQIAGWLPELWARLTFQRAVKDELNHRGKHHD